MIGKILVINGEELRVGDNLSYSYDLDSLSNSGSIDLPFNPIYKYVEKFIPIQIYVGEVDTFQYRKEDLIKVWDGYILDASITESKTAPAVNIEFGDKLQFFNFTEPLRPSVGGLISEFVSVMKQSYAESGVTIPFEIEVLAEDKVTVNPPKENNILEQISAIKEKSVLYIDYDPVKNKMKFMTPFFLQYLTRPTEAYVFDTKNILSQLKLASSTAYITGVVFEGHGGRKGVAVDFLAYSLGRKGKIERHKAMHTANVEDLERMARNRLLEASRSSLVEFNAPINTTTLKMRPGQLIQIKDTQLFDGEVFIIKNLSYSISKKGDVILTIKAFASILSALPSGFVTKDVNITDINTLRQKPDKVIKAAQQVYGYGE